MIAATSGAAKVVASGGGFETSTTAKCAPPSPPRSVRSLARADRRCGRLRSVMFGQIQLIGIGDGKLEAVQQAAAAVTAAKPEIIAEANTYCESMQRRGGGVVDVTPRIVPHREGSGLTGENLVPDGGVQLVVHIHIDVQSSMGANLINTVVEGVSDSVFAIAATAAPSDNARPGVRILSNMCPERLAKASFRVPASELAYKGFSGAEVGRRIVETWRFAFDDPFRAVTHNKGVMNGIDAVAVATGQDWRAIEAGAHAYSTAGLGTDAYAPLTRYSWHVPESGNEDEGWLEGLLEMPMPLGTVSRTMFAGGLGCNCASNDRADRSAARCTSIRRTCSRTTSSATRTPPAWRRSSPRSGSRRTWPRSAPWRRKASSAATCRCTRATSPCKRWAGPTRSRRSTPARARGRGRGGWR